MGSNCGSAKFNSTNKLKNSYMNRFAHIVISASLLSGILMICGCGNGNQTGYVSGKVTLQNGNDPAGLLIRFMNPSAGIGATALVADDGTYSLRYKGNAGVPIGTFKIAVTAHVKLMNDLEVVKFMELSGAEQAKVTAERSAKKVLVPEKYRSTETSDLSYEIVSGTQTHDIVVPE